MRIALCLLALAGVAHAEPTAIETGMFAGGFVANYFHQFYDESLYTAATRPRLGAIDPEVGARVAYFFGPDVAVEAEASMIAARVIDVPSIATIYNLRAQVVAQIPGIVTPFVAAGIGLAHLSSNADVLGNDTDFPIHVGCGIRWYVADGLALRADGRLLRGPSTTGTLGATYGEVLVGVSFVTRP